MGTIEEYLTDYEMKLRCKTSSLTTIKNYMGMVERFLRWCSGKKGDPVNLIIQYLARSISGCPRTHNLHRASIVSFFALCKGICLSTKDVPRKREPRQLPTILSQEKVVEAIEKTINLKHRLELCLFYGCGLRLSEVANLRRKNISIERNLLVLSDTKGGKHRIVPIPNSMVDLLFEFIHGMAPAEYVFKGMEKGSHITPKSLQNVVAQAFERIGVHCHPHMLRHSYATHQILAGESPFKLQRWMGHSSSKTTEGYVYLAEDHLSKATDLLAKRNYAKVSWI